MTLSNQGYAKTQPIADYEAQRRGGRGRSASSVKEEDFIERLLVANSHDTILCFTNRGKVYWLSVFEIPAASRASRGRPMINILPLEADERINAMLPVTTYDEGKFIFMATGNGTIKKTPLTDFARPRSSGLIAIELEPGNPLVGVAITDGASDVMLFGSGGKVIRFKESDVRAMGRTARGVRGIKLRPSEQVISLIIPDEDAEVLIASDRGYGKRSQISDFSVIGRGGQGMIGMKLGDRNGEVVSAIQVHEGDEAMLISDRGSLVRIRTEEVSQQGRNTQGVRLINLASDEKLVGIGRVQEPDDDLIDEASAEATESSDGPNDPSDGTSTS